MFASFSEQIGGVSDTLEALQHLYDLVQLKMNANAMRRVDYETELSPVSFCPRIVLGKETLERLLDTHLPVECIAKCLGVSRRTVYRRMQEFNLTVRGSYSTKTDQEHDQEISTSDAKCWLPHDSRTFGLQWVSVFNGAG